MPYSCELFNSSLQGHTGTSIYATVLTITEMRLKSDFTLTIYDIFYNLLLNDSEHSMNGDDV